LSSGSRDQLCSPPVILLWSWVFTVLVYWWLVSLPSPLFWAKSEVRQLALCFQHVMLVFWLFFNFAASFDFGYCSLTQDVSFVDHYLPYFRQQLITGPLLALLPFQSLFTEDSCRDQLLTPPPFSSTLTASHPLCCLVLFSSLFIVQVFFCGTRGQFVQGAMLIYPMGGCGNTM
jgi:hypothetical protein